jgi:hypothetical protein
MPHVASTIKTDQTQRKSETTNAQRNMMTPAVTRSGRTIPRIKHPMKITTATIAPRSA